MVYEGKAQMYYKGKKLQPDTPEADELARKILTTLYELAAAAQGCRLESIVITRKDEEPETTT